MEARGIKNLVGRGPGLGNNANNSAHARPRAHPIRGTLGRFAPEWANCVNIASPSNSLKDTFGRGPAPAREFGRAKNHDNNGANIRRRDNEE